MFPTFPFPSRFHSQLSHWRMSFAYVFLLCILSESKNKILQAILMRESILNNSDNCLTIHLPRTFLVRRFFPFETIGNEARIHHYTEWPMKSCIDGNEYELLVEHVDVFVWSPWCDRWKAFTLQGGHEMRREEVHNWVGMLGFSPADPESPMMKGVRNYIWWRWKVTKISFSNDQTYHRIQKSTRESLRNWPGRSLFLSSSQMVM